MLTTPVINTAKIATCNSLSGLTELQYHLGYEAGSKDKIRIRVAASTGSGKFNACFWSLAEIEKALSNIPANASFPISALKPVFVGRSVNTMYFVLAALLDCGFFRRADPVENGYVRNAPEVWLPKLQALIEAGTNLLPDSMAKAAEPLVVTIPKSTKKSPKKPSPTTTA